MLNTLDSRRPVTNGVPRHIDLDKAVSLEDFLCGNFHQPVELTVSE